jgi:arsenite methyltransferase
MSDLQAKMFNRKASNPKNKPDEIIGAIGLKPGQSIADIGSGGGYFSFRFAEAVGDKGKVYAIDASQEYLGYVKGEAERKGLNNVEPLFASGAELNLPEKTLDCVFMRNVTHHIKDRKVYFRNLSRYLKPDGRFAVIEYNMGKAISFRRLFGHHVAKRVIIEEMNEAGYILEKEFGFLPEQHFCIFKKAKGLRSTSGRTK